MARRLILVRVQDLGVEICGRVPHGAGVREGLGSAAVGVRGGRFEDLVLGGGFLELELQALVLLGDVRGVLLEGGEFGFEVFDVALLAFAEGSLAGVC
jgi:hypothetical protein